jgi:lipoprotein-anchoring transpeptidase ErfK/SrfK
MIKYFVLSLGLGLTIAVGQPVKASDLPPVAPVSPVMFPVEPLPPALETTLPERIPTVTPTVNGPDNPPVIEAPVAPAAPIELPLRLELKLSKRQVTLYRGDQAIKSYPVAVGKPGWETPTGTFQVQHKVEKPTWVHPLREGIVIPGGDPDNPLGNYWVGFWTDGTNWIGFHGTPTPESIGKAASHGCVRMYNKDIAELFPQLSVGTVVTVVK